jgi:2-octaprenyl-6-methoxyphenol hydroxylase
VWHLCAEYAAPLRTMRIADDTGRLLRAPEVRFEAAEIDLDAFGYNIENYRLVAALEKRADELPALTIISGQVQQVECRDRDVVVAVASGNRFAVSLAIGADGRQSLCRSAAGITTTERAVSQSALTLCFRHSRPHRDISTEFHTLTGPFTVVPLPGQRSSLVWVLDPAGAERIARLDDASLAEEIERRSHSILGKITLEPGRGIFPLSIVTARRFAANRVALVGEAAHVVPPIGAQGLNLGLRDVATISELVIDAWRDGDDIGAEPLLAGYHAMRSGDVGTRTLMIDLLNRSLLSDFLPLQGARGFGMLLIEKFGPLRRALMREGVMPAAAQPRLMRGQAL